MGRVRQDRQCSVWSRFRQNGIRIFRTILCSIENIVKIIVHRWRESATVQGKVKKKSTKGSTHVID